MPVFNMNKLVALKADESIFLSLFQQLPLEAKEAEIAKLAREVCNELPDSLFFLQDGINEIDTDTKITAILKKSIPIGSPVVLHVGDYWRDMLDMALGDSDDMWPQVLGGWRDSIGDLTESLIESVAYYSEYYPGFTPNWEEDEIKDFIYDWRRRFFDKLISMSISVKSI